MLSRLKLHYNEGCINVIANEKVYWSDNTFIPLKGIVSIADVPRRDRYIYTGRTTVQSF